MRCGPLIVILIALAAESLSFAQASPEVKEQSGISEAAPAPPPPTDNLSLAQYHYTLALLRLSSGNSPTERLMMVTELRKAIQLRPDFVEAHALLGEILLQSGDTDGALDEFRLAARLRPGNPQTHLALGNALIAKHDWKAAGAELKEALRLDPSLAQAHYNLGGIQYTTGHPQQAIRSYQEALRLQPDFADAHYRLGLVLKLAGREKESVGQLQKAAEGGVARAQYFLGNAYRSGHGIERSLPMAIQWWMRAFEQGLDEADIALSQLRRVALSGGSRASKQATTIREGFEAYCRLQWQDYPDLEASAEDETLGTTLLKVGPADRALPALLREGYALSELAHARLEALYLEGGGEGLDRYDSRILQYLLITAGDGFQHSRATLAVVYGKGLGVNRDRGKSKEFLRGLPEAEANRVREELANEATGS